MLTLALVVALDAGSLGGAVDGSSSPPAHAFSRSARLLDQDLVGSAERAWRLLALAPGEVSPRGGSLALRIADLDESIRLLEGRKDGLGWPIGTIVLGSVLTLGGAIFGPAGFVLAVRGAWALLAVCVVGFVVGIALVVAGAVMVATRSRTNRVSDQQIEELQRQRDSLERDLQAPVPSGSLRPAPAPRMTVVRF